MQVTTNQIKTRLAQSFNNVNTLKEFASSILINAPYQHTTTVLNICSGEFSIGVYSLDNEINDDSLFIRFVYCFDTKQAFTF